MRYIGRPGISPALAALVSLGRIHKQDRILDVGCGTGTDAITLARWGFRRVDAIDPDVRAIQTARMRAKRARLSGRVTFHPAAAEQLTQTFPAGTFDVVLHTLVANNLHTQKQQHFSQVAAVMKPNALLVLHERVIRRSENAAPGRFPPLAAIKRHFDVGPGVATHLAEHPTGRRGPSYARVVLWIGRPR